MAGVKRSSINAVTMILGENFLSRCIRPHQSLDYLTPYEYYQRWLKELKPKVSLMPWTSSNLTANRGRR